MVLTDYLKKLESAGFKAYFVGGFVRDRLLGIKSLDIDIATSANPDKVKKIFNLDKSDNFGSFTLQNENFSIDITSFRIEKKYLKRKPQKLKYTTSLKKDAKRRDFTINSIYMDCNNNLIDPFNGQRDLNNKIIRAIGNPNKKFKEDPLRILRALRLSIIYDFKIETKTLKAIIKNANLLKELSYERKKEELSKILISYNSKKGLTYLCDLGILEILEIKIPKSYCASSDILKSWSQLEYSDKYPFSNKEIKQIKKFKEMESD